MYCKWYYHYHYY